MSVMNKPFYIHNAKSINLSYTDILQSVNSANVFMPYYKAENERDFYLNFILGLVNNKEITLIDIDSHTDEVQNLIGLPDLLEATENVFNKFDDVNALIKGVHSSQAKITLFTSGTTGQPKKITHSVEHFIQTARISDNHAEDRWAFAYNPTHMAGLRFSFRHFSIKISW